jgi:hypothetical protein
MKKIFSLIAFCALFFTINAQVTIEPSLNDRQRFRDALLYEWDIVTPSNTINKYFFWDLPVGVKYKINISADSLFATAFVDTVNYAQFILTESTNGVNFTGIDTVKWYGTTEDTSFIWDRTGSVSLDIDQELSLSDSTATFEISETATGYNYIRYVGVEAKVDSTGGQFLWTNCDITIWLEQ